MSNRLYKAAPFFTLRAPMWAVEDFQRLAKGDAALELYYSNQQLREAIALAVPDLQCRSKERLAKTIFNYVKRMSTRTTPFGKFAGVMHGRFGEMSDTFLDLSKLTTYVPMQQQIPSEGPYYPNPLIQKRGGRFYLGTKSISAAVNLLEHKARDTLIRHRFLLSKQTPSLLTLFTATHRSPIFQLSHTIAEEVEKRVEEIWEKHSQRPLKRYLKQFLERYGIYRTIPLMEIFRDESWEGITTEKLSPEHAPHSLDLFCKITPNGVIVTELHCMGGSAMGRFLSTLGVDAKEDLELFFRQEEALDPCAQFVEVSYLPQKGAEIATIPCLRKLRLDLHGPSNYTLSDLYVGATHDRFYLTTKEGGVEIIPRAGHRLNPDLAPDPIRFMFEIHRTVAYEEPHEGSVWLKSERGHHFCEIVVPLVKNKCHAKKEFIPRAHMTVPHEQRWKFPGEEWFYVKFYTDEIDHFLLEHLAPYAEKLGVQWYFVRYADPKKHIRFRAKTAQIPDVREWMKEGLIDDMQICCYEREIERYGGVEGMAEAEKIFCWDTARVIEELKSARKPGWEALSVITFIKSLGLEEIPGYGGDKSQLKGFREHKNRLLELLDTLMPEPIPFTTRSIEICDSLLHMHCNRLGCNEAKARAWAGKLFQIKQNTKKEIIASALGNHVLPTAKSVRSI